MKSSDLLFNVLPLFDFRIKIFSSKHRSHDLPPAVYAGTRLIIDHTKVREKNRASSVELAVEVRLELETER